jgi:HEAT repeat protein
MEKGPCVDLDSIVNRLADLTTTERTTALRHLFDLRLAAVEDLSDLSDQRNNWETALNTTAHPDSIKILVQDLTQLTEEELAAISARVSEKLTTAHGQALENVDESKRLSLQAQLAARAEQSVAYPY